MKRSFAMSRYWYTAAFAIFAPVLLPGAGIPAPDVTVGRNLQAPVGLILPAPAPAEGLQLTIASEDAARLTIAPAPDRAGAASITLTVRPGAVVAPEFWVQGLAAHGSLKYSVSAPGFASTQGNVTLAPAAILIVGPFRLPSFPTTPRSTPAKLTVVSAMLDPSGAVVAEQPIAGGKDVPVKIGNSSPETGAVADPTVTLAGGASTASTVFKPAAEGSANLSIIQPAGFSPPAKYGRVTAVVDRPGLALTDQFTIGKDLQLLGVLCLGETAPDGGLQVTLTSSDPSKLILSAKEDQPGAGELVLTVPAGALTAQYYIQALSDSGEVTYKAVANGFRRRIAKIDLAPSGFIVAYDHYGPPDEAAVLRNDGHKIEDRRFYVSMAATDKPVEIAVYSAYLALAGKLAADITVQPIRAGVTAAVRLNSSNPAVGSVESPVLIKSGSARAIAHFKAVKPGETIISIETPPGFTRPGNSTTAPATVAP
jgi:hypothetical protein